MRTDFHMEKDSTVTVKHFPEGRPFSVIYLEDANGNTVGVFCREDADLEKIRGALNGATIQGEAADHTKSYRQVRPQSDRAELARLYQRALIECLYADAELGQQWEDDND